MIRTLYIWKILGLLEPEPEPESEPEPEPEPELIDCELVVSIPLSRDATKSTWAAAGSVVERI